MTTWDVATTTSRHEAGIKEDQIIINGTVKQGWKQIMTFCTCTQLSQEAGVLKIIKIQVFFHATLYYSELRQIILCSGIDQIGFICIVQ